MNESGKWSGDKLNEEKERLRVRINLLKNDIPFFPKSNFGEAT